MVKKSQKDSAKKQLRDIRDGIGQTVGISKIKQVSLNTPPVWQMYNMYDLDRLVKMGNQCCYVSVIDGSNQPPPGGLPKRVTLVVASPPSLMRWRLWFGVFYVFFLMVPDPKAEDPIIGSVLERLRKMTVYVQTGDTKEGDITLGGAVAAKNGCNVVFFSKAHNSPLPTNKTVQQFHHGLHKGIAKTNGGNIHFLGFSENTPKAESEA